MSDLRALYQEVILDHNRHPHNFRAMPAADHLEGDRILDASFQGSGCAISTASASILTDSIKGKTLAEAQSLFARFHELVTGKAAADGQELGKLAVFSGVSEFPARVKCATLAWHTLKSALERGEPVSTEKDDGGIR
ncbi:MAG: SUF system NifU family Fe-S cluster assembly protein [Acidobacteria bacterium]|nr:MAG: SUF system NifU family Fe-S cluster assembly protein [Acidobacteriota bacterium]